MQRKPLLGAIAVLSAFLSGIIATSSPSFADETIKPAVVYSTGGKFDGAFNQSAFTGAEKFKTDTGIDYREFELRNDTQSQQAIRTFARDGHDPVVVIGFQQASALAEVAPEFPEIRFVIVDMVVDQPNVQSVVFREHEGSFIVGMLAAMASNSNTIGAVGGMDIPLIRRMTCGYQLGAHYVKSDANVLVNFVGTTGAAWNDPIRGGELTKTQIGKGADVVLQLAGGTGIGVLQAASDAKILGIGSDANQNGLHPGQVLTSMVKHVDVAVYEAFKAAREGNWQPGIKSLGLAEGGIDWALDENNRDLMTDDMEVAAKQAKADIISGKITIHDYMIDNTCPN